MLHLKYMPASPPAPAVFSVSHLHQLKHPLQNHCYRDLVFLKTLLNHDFFQLSKDVTAQFFPCQILFPVLHHASPVLFLAYLRAVGCYFSPSCDCYNIHSGFYLAVFLHTHTDNYEEPHVLILLL